MNKRVLIAIAVGLRLLLYRSRTGTAMRAVVDNPDLAALNGARPTTIARYSWVLGSMLAGLAGVTKFAPLALGDELLASVVDVPGHEKFVKNMLAGASGIDLLALVIAGFIVRIAYRIFQRAVPVLVV